MEQSQKRFFLAPERPIARQVATNYSLAEIFNNDLVARESGQEYYYDEEEEMESMEGERAGKRMQVFSEGDTLCSLEAALRISDTVLVIDQETNEIWTREEVDKNE